MTKPTQEPSPVEARIVELDIEIGLISDQGAQAGNTLEALMDMAAQAKVLQAERERLVAGITVTALEGITLAVPADAEIRFTLAKDTKDGVTSLGIASMAITSPSLSEAIRASIGDLWEVIRTTASLTSLTYINGSVTLGAAPKVPTTNGSQANGATNGSRALVVNGISYVSAAAAYRGAIGEMSTTMSGDAIERALKKAGHHIA
jgi:hypothetical protein